MRSNTSTFNTTNSWNYIKTANDNSMIPQNNSQPLNTTNGMKVSHWNCNSIKNKINEFLVIIQLNQPDLISLNEIKCCETWAIERLCVNS